MTTHREGRQATRYSRMEAGLAAAELQERLDWEHRMQWWSVATQAFPLMVYRANELSMNKLAAAPVQTTRKRQFWRQIGALMVRDMRLPVEGTLGPVRVVVGYGFESRRIGAREGVNLAPTTKALLDGMVAAGLAVDDSERFVLGQDSRLLPGLTPKGQVWVVAMLYAEPGQPGG